MAVSVRLDSHDLNSRIRSLLGDERHVQVDFLLCLAESDEVKGYEAFDYVTLWQYCERALGLLECAIARRIQAMRILRRFPTAEAYLRDGRLCMTGIGMLERVLTPENHVGILDRASRKSTREIAAIAAESNAPVPEKTTLRPGAGDVTSAAGSADADGADPREGERRSDPQDRATPTTKQTVRQVSARQFKLTLVVGEEFKAKIDRVKKIYSHRIPSGNLEAILGAALDLVLAKDEKRHGLRPVRKTPRATRTSTASGRGTAGSAPGFSRTGSAAAPNIRCRSTTSFPSQLSQER